MRAPLDGQLGGLIACMAPVIGPRRFFQRPQATMECNFRALMMPNRPPHRLSSGFRRVITCALSSCVLVGGVYAQNEQGLSTEIKADALRYDEKQKSSVFTGNVVLTRGSLKITGNQLTLKEDERGGQTGLATGSPARFERVRAQAANELIQGEAKRISYDSRSNTMQLRGDGLLRRLRDGKLSDEVRGEAIDYFDDTGKFSAQGQSTPSGSGRVRVIIGPKPASAGAQ